MLLILNFVWPCHARNKHNYDVSIVKHGICRKEINMILLSTERRKKRLVVVVCALYEIPKLRYMV